MTINYGVHHLNLPKAVFSVMKIREVKLSALTKMPRDCTAQAPVNLFCVLTDDLPHRGGGG